MTSYLLDCMDNGASFISTNRRMKLTLPVATLLLTAAISAGCCRAKKPSSRSSDNTPETSRASVSEVGNAVSLIEKITELRCQRFCFLNPEAVNVDLTSGRMAVCTFEREMSDWFKHMVSRLFDNPAETVVDLNDELAKQAEIMEHFQRRESFSLVNAQSVGNRNVPSADTMTNYLASQTERLKAIFHTLFKNELAKRLDSLNTASGGSKAFGKPEANE